MLKLSWKFVGWKFELSFVKLMVELMFGFNFIFNIGSVWVLFVIWFRNCCLIYFIGIYFIIIYFWKIFFNYDKNWNKMIYKLWIMCKYCLL